MGSNGSKGNGGFASYQSRERRAAAKAHKGNKREKIYPPEYLYPRETFPYDKYPGCEEAVLAEGNDPHIPLARCKVIYIGSAVPTGTSVGVEALQQPLRDRFPLNKPQGAEEVKGIEVWLTIFSSGILLQYVGDQDLVTWFPIHNLHIAVAVRCVPDPRTGYCHFAPLDQPGADQSDLPPMFAMIARRNEGVKVLEAHAFILRSEEGAMAMVQAAIHAFQHEEGWAQAPPSKDQYETIDKTIIVDPYNPEVDMMPADGDMRPPAPPPARPPTGKGFYYTDRKDLIKKFSMVNPEAQRIPNGYFDDWNDTPPASSGVFAEPAYDPRFDNYPELRELNYDQAALAYPVMGYVDNPDPYAYAAAPYDPYAVAPYNPY